MQAHCSAQELDSEAVVRALCVPTQYMAFEIAPQLLIAQLEALPPGEMRVISGSSMDATPEDIALLKASGRVVKTPARKKVQKKIGAIWEKTLRPVPLVDQK